MRRHALVVWLATVVLAPCLVVAEGERMYPPNPFREGRPGDVLVVGSPALLRGNLDAFVDLVQSSFDVALTAEAEQTLRDALENGFGAADATKRQAFLDAVLPFASLKDRARQGDRDAVRQGLAEFRLAIDRRLQDLPRARASQVLAQVLTRRHETAWAGTPPIHGVAADAYVELATFVASLGRNEDATATPGQLDALRRDLDAAFRGKPEAVRERVNRAHRTWVLVKARWDAADDAKRFPMRWEAVRVAARAAPPGQERDVSPGPDLAAYARAAATVAAARPAFDTLSNLARNPEALLEALEKGLTIPKEIPDEILLHE